MAYRRRRKTGGSSLRRRAARRRFQGRRSARSSNAYRKVTPSRGLTLPFPTRFNCIHKFNNILTLTQSVAATPVINQYRLNYLYDPNYTAASGRNNQQPLWYDQMAAIYNDYVVYGVQVSVLASADRDTYFWMTPTQNNTAAATSSILQMERPWTTKRYFAGGSNAVRMKTYYDIGRIWGANKTRCLTDDSYRSAVLAIPDKVAYFTIGAESANGSTLTTANVSIQFKYYVQWSKRIEASES